MTYAVLATPSFEGRPCREYMVSILQTDRLLHEMGIDHETTILAGDPYLSKVRNRLISAFLENPNATDLFFLDDDIGWPAHKVVEFLNRPEDIVCGIYPQKNDALAFPVTLDMERGAMVERAGLYRGVLVPTGFMRIKRHVLEQMAMQSGRYEEKSADGRMLMQFNITEARYVDLQMEQLRSADLDTLTREEAIAHLKRSIGIAPSSDLGQYWGEDYFLAQRWRDMGGEVWVDPEIPFTHRGSKAWSANFGDTIRATLARQKPMEAA